MLSFALRILQRCKNLSFFQAGGGVFCAHPPATHCISFADLDDALTDAHMSEYI